MLRQIGDKDQTIQNLEALLQKTKDSVSQLEAEREDLVAKIQAGEGETAVLNQLQEKNHTLQTQVGLGGKPYFTIYGIDVQTGLDIYFTSHNIISMFGLLNVIYM